MRSPMAQRRVRGAYRMCFNTPAGRLVLKDLYDFCNVMQPTQRADAHHTAHEEGKRRVFLRIFHMMKPDDERQKLQELEETRYE